MGDFVENTKKSENKTSVWLHFLKSKTKSEAKCKHCNKILLTSGGSTSALRNHLKNKHLISLDSSKIAHQQLENEEATPSTSKKPKKITEYLTTSDSMELTISRMVTLDGIAFRVFANSADLRRLFKKKIKRPVTSRPNEDESGRFFIQYNNLPMGAEKVGNRLFIALPRRNYGIPATLNYIDLNTQTERSPSLKPYPDVFRSRSLISVYRTRSDTCNRLWMVDTGLLELSVISNRRQLQPPGIVIFDLNTNQQILRYTLKDTDVPSATTPAGLASITVDITGNCDDAYAYIPDLSTYGIIVYSLKDNDSWRLQHNYFSYNPVAGNIRVAGEYFQWSDGIFSITLSPPTPDTCRKAYFHPLVSTEEFAVSTCVLKNKTASSDRYFFDKFSYLGDRGQNSQCTMHDYHERTGVIFFADIGRDGISCWNTVKPLSANTVSVLAQHDDLLSYPADLHVTGDEVWVITNRLPRFGYSRLNTDEYNFFIYKGHVQRLIYGTPCAVY